jgi:Ca2+-binding RTX toxin-like protein
VQSSVSRALGANLEKLTLTGSAAISGTGNALANTIIGNSAANTLDGAAGADTMKGGGGNDTYIVDSAGDVTTEASAGGGIDLVKSSVSRALGAFLENLTLTGSGNINGTGNTLANVLTGNSFDNVLNGDSGADTLRGGMGADKLNGGVGIDKLTGGAGADTFIFNAALIGANRDTVVDFSALDDTIKLENAVFSGLAAGALAAPAFRIGAAAADATDRIIYDATNGRLYFDVDGLGGAAQIQFAKLSAGLALTAADFVVI